MNELFLPFSVLTVVNAIGWALIHFVWQGFLIAAITWSLLLLLRNAAPQTRYAILCTALLICVALPVGAVWQAWQLHGGGASSMVSGASMNSIVDFQTQLLWQQFAQWLHHHLHWLVLCWAVIVMLFSVRLGFGLFWLHAYQDARRGVENKY